jgi:hypothetical protein
MSRLLNAADAALSEADRLRTFLRRRSDVQVRSSDERSAAKATALAWFNNHRPAISEVLGDPPLSELDCVYQEILAAADRASARSKYITRLKEVREVLILLRSQGLTSRTPPQHTTDQPPSFAPLIADQQMQSILAARWGECVSCLGAGAPLATTVMVGGLLEGLLLARINREGSKAAIFQARHAPKDKSGRTKSLTEWTLRNYIEVAHELGWISVSAKDVSEVLRDYRNYIHPFKELSHGITLTPKDATLLWEISKNVCRQVLDSVP